MRFTCGFIMGAIVGAKFNVAVLFYLNLASEWIMQYLKGVPTPPAG